MPLSKEKTRLIERAGIFGAGQALFHFIFCILCLVFFYIDPKFDRTRMTLIRAVYMRFLDDTDIIVSSGAVIKPRLFADLNWFYITLDCFWFVLSVRLICDSTQNDRKLYKIIRAFVFTTIIIFILDLILVICLIIDYKKPCVFMNSGSSHRCQEAVIPVLIIAGKGFLLWIVNFVFIFKLNRISGMLRREVEGSHLTPSTQMPSTEKTGADIFPTDDTFTSTTGADLEYRKGARYTYKWQWAYRPGTEWHINPITGRLELRSVMVYSYACDYVPTDD